MFTAEQYITSKLKNQTKKAVLMPGTALARRKTVKLRFTYREFTLILGVLVALIVVFAVWFNQNSQIAQQVPVLNNPPAHHVDAALLVRQFARQIFASSMF